MFEYTLEKMKIPTRTLPPKITETEEVTIGGNRGDVYIDTINRTPDGGIILTGITLKTTEENLATFEVVDMVNSITYKCWQSIGAETWMGKRHK